MVRLNPRHRTEWNVVSIDGKPVSAATTVGAVRRHIAQTEGVQLAAVQLSIDDEVALDDTVTLGDAFNDDANRYWYELTAQPQRWNGHRGLRSQSKSSLGSCSKCHTVPAAQDHVEWTAHACGHYVCAACLETVPEGLRCLDNTHVMCPVCCSQTQALVTLPGAAGAQREVDREAEHVTPQYEAVAGLLPSMERLEAALRCQLREGGCPNRATVKCPIGRPACATCNTASRSAEAIAVRGNVLPSPLTPVDILCFHEHVEDNGYHAVIAQKYCVECEQSLCNVCEYDAAHNDHNKKELEDSQQNRHAMFLWSYHAQKLQNVEHERSKLMGHYHTLCENDVKVVQDIVADAAARTAAADAQYDEQIDVHQRAIVALEAAKGRNRVAVESKKMALLQSHRDAFEKAVDELRTCCDELNAQTKRLLDRHVLLTQVTESAPGLLWLKGAVTDFTTPTADDDALLAGGGEGVGVSVTSYAKRPVPPLVHYTLSDDGTKLSAVPPITDDVDLNMTLVTEPLERIVPVRYVLLHRRDGWTAEQCIMNSYHLLLDRFADSEGALSHHTEELNNHGVEDWEEYCSNAFVSSDEWKKKNVNVSREDFVEKMKSRLQSMLATDEPLPTDFADGWLDDSDSSDVDEEDEEEDDVVPEQVQAEWLKKRVRCGKLALEALEM